MQVAAGVHQPELGLIDLHTKVTVNQEVVTRAKILFARRYFLQDCTYISNGNGYAASLLLKIR